MDTSEHVIDKTMKPQFFNNVNTPSDQLFKTADVNKRVQIVTYPSIFTIVDS